MKLIALCLTLVLFFHGVESSGSSVQVGGSASSHASASQRSRTVTTVHSSSSSTVTKTASTKHKGHSSRARKSLSHRWRWSPSPSPSPSWDVRDWETRSSPSGWYSVPSSTPSRAGSYRPKEESAPVTYKLPRSSPSREAPRSSVASEVFDAVLEEDIRWVAKQLTKSNDLDALAQGFRFPAKKREELLTKTKGRRGDPDVITIKAFAEAALKSKEYYRLSQVMVRAVYPEADEHVRYELEQLLRDRKLMIKTRFADPRTEFLPSSGTRRLLCDGCTPVNSFVCAHCWTSVVCSKFHWCPSQ